MIYENYTKIFLTKFILMSLNIKQSTIVSELHFSQSQVSRLIAGEQTNPTFDRWIVRQIEKVYCN